MFSHKMSAKYLAVSIASCIASSVVHAQLEEVIVTAQKQSENIQNVPMAISALSGDALADNHVTDIGALAQLVPNVGFSDAVGQTRIAIRGITFDNIIATGAEARVAAHLDGVYLSRSGAVGGTFFDIDRVEVLRGPQGTLFGRNAVAGAVNIVTKNPTPDWDGYVQGDLGNYDSMAFDAAVGGPITDNVAFRIAGRTADHDGYGSNLTTGQDVDDLHQRAVRAKLLIEPTDAVRLVLSGDYSKRDDNTGIQFAGYLYPGTVVLGSGRVRTSDARDTYSDTQTKQKIEFKGLTADLEIDLGNDYTLASITGWRDGKHSTINDYDYTDAALLAGASGESAEQISEELRLHKDFDRGTWMVGAYYFKEMYTAQSHVLFNAVLFPGGPFFLTDGLYYGGNLETHAYAFFTQGTYDITDELHLTLGARYGEDRKRLTGEFYALNFGALPDYSTIDCMQPCTNVSVLPQAAPKSRNWFNFSPRVTLQYDLSSDANVYATYSEGFKSGGFNVGLEVFGGGFNPEDIKNYEVGFKGVFFDNTVRANTAAFFYDYSNLQVFKVLDQTIGATIQNAAGAEIYGIEAEIEIAPTDNLVFDIAAAAMDTEFTDFETADPARPNGPNGNPAEPFDLSGNRLPSAPKYTLSYGVQYTWNLESIGDLTLRGEGNSISDVYYDQFNAEGFSEDEYSLFNAFLNWKSVSGQYYGSLYARNITDEERISGGTLSNGFSGFAVQTAYIPPRTYGITFGVRL